MAVALRIGRTDLTAEEYIKNHEGLRLKAYKDSLGYPTIGWGHLCVKNEYTEIDEEKAQELFNKDLIETQFFVGRLFPDFSQYSENRKTALLDMAFQLRGNLTHFPKAMAHIKAQEWTEAVCDLLDSLWARKQTPSRAIDNAILLIKG